MRTILFILLMALPASAAERLLSSDGYALYSSDGYALYAASTITWNSTGNMDMFSTRDHINVTAAGKLRSGNFIGSKLTISAAAEVINVNGYRPGDDALDIVSGGPTITTSLFSDTDPAAGYTDGGGNYWGDNPLWASDSNFRLKRRSPSRDTGTDWGQTVDIQGFPLSGLGWNIGPYERTRSNLYIPRKKTWVLP